jgi:DNA-binding protein YbaB
MTGMVAVVMRNSGEIDKLRILPELIRKVGERENEILRDAFPST